MCTLRASASVLGLLFQVLRGLILIVFVGQIIMKIVFVWFELGVN